MKDHTDNFTERVAELKMLQSKIEIDLESEEREAKEMFWLF